MQLMSVLQWQRVVVVYFDNDFGRDTANEFVRLSQNSDVCVVEMIPIKPTPDVPAWMESIRDIGKYGVTGAVFFGDNAHKVHNLLVQM